MAACLRGGSVVPVGQRWHAPRDSALSDLFESRSARTHRLPFSRLGLASDDDSA